MATRANFRTVTAVLLCILAPGTLPSAASPLSADTTDLEFAAVPPSPDDPKPPTSSMEPVIGGVGSAAPTPRAQDAVELSPPAGADPWADAFAESARLGRLAVESSPAYPLVRNREVEYFLDRFTGSRRSVVGLWLNRSARYVGMIREVMRKHGLPEELAFTAMVESGFNPIAVSPAGAKGLWQFMASTARRYGLRVDRWVDERLDPEKSTLAAAGYLRDLYTQFGSWALAQAAYNAGEVTVARAIRATGSTDFWTLARTRFLRRETKEFVPQIHAVTMIGREPDRYGFEVAEPAPTAVDSVTVPPSTDLRRISTAAGISAEMLRALNPTLVRGVTPPGAVWELKIPAGTRTGVLASLLAPPKVARAKGAVRAAGSTHVHVVRPYDTVGSIAKRYGVTVEDVLRWNRLERQDRLRPGDRLRVVGLRSPAERD